MFGIGMPELLPILGLALIVLTEEIRNSLKLWARPVRVCRATDELKDEFRKMV
jgi:hypothetical protein